MQLKNKPIIVVLNWMDILNPHAGGQEKYVYEMARRLVSDGYDVKWVASGYPGMKEHEIYEGIDIVRTGNIYTYFISYFRYYLKLRHNALFFISINSIPFLLPLRRSRRLVMFHHRIDLKVMLEKIGILGYFSYFLQEFVNPILYKRDHIITNSQSSRDDFLELGYRDINVIRLGINIPESRSNSKRRIVVSPGPIKPWKHHDMVMKAVSKLDANWELWIFGSQESGIYTHSLESLSASLGISNRVKLLGRISDAEVGRIFEESELCVLGTEKEGWGLVAMEAQSYGCPVVAFDVPGIRESVVNGRTGLLVEFGDVNALAEAIKKIAYDDEVYRTMSQYAVKRSREYSWDVCYREFQIELNKVMIPDGVFGDASLAQDEGA